MDPRGPGWLQHQFDGFIVFYPAGSVVERWLDDISARLRRVQRSVFTWIEADSRPILVYLTDPVVAVTWPGISALTEQLATRSDLVWQSFSPEHPAEDQQRRTALALLQRDRPQIAASVLLGVAGIFGDPPTNPKRSSKPFNDQSGDEITSILLYLQRHFGRAALDRFVASLLRGELDPASSTLGLSLRDVISLWRNERVSNQPVVNGMRHAVGHAVRLLRMSRLTGSILLSVLFSVGLAALPLLLHTAFNTLLDDYDTQQLVTWGAATLGSVVVFAVLYAWKASTDSKLVAMVQQEARQRVLIAVQQGPIDQANRDVRSLNRRVLDAEIAGDATRHVPALILDLFLVVASGMVLTFLYWPIAVAVLITCLVVFLLILATGKAGTNDDRPDDTTTVGRVLEELVSAQRVMRAYAAEAFVTSRVTRGLQDTVARQPRSATSVGVAALFILGLPLAVLYAGIWLTNDGVISTGTLLALTLASSLPVPALAALSNSLRRLEATGPVFHRLEAESQFRDDMVDDPLAVDIVTIQSSIRFNKISTLATSQSGGLRGISFAVAVGSHTALLTAGGHRTIADLLLRLEDPEDGTITIDGNDLRLIRIAALRAISGVVQPDPYVLPGTLVENIRLGNQAASIDAVVAAAQAAGFDGFASRLPDGYATRIGDGGLQLTIDQREHLALARAMVRQPSLLLLEHPKGALDAAAEATLLNTMQRLHGTSTILTTTDSPTVASIADRIIVLDNGKVVDQGTHDDLMMKRGLYWRLWSDQHRDKDVIDSSLLGQMPLFAGLEPSDLSAINRRLRIVQEHAGTDVVREYDAADAFYMIEAGVVEVIATGSAGPKRVNVLGPGSFFGEIALLEMHALRTATVRALTPVRLYRLDKGDFLDLFRMHPSLASRVASESRQRLDQLRAIQ